jgi:hypothetical protein
VRVGMSVLQWSRSVLPSDNHSDARLIHQVPVGEPTGT